MSPITTATYAGLADKIEGEHAADRQARHGGLAQARADRRGRRHRAMELAAVPRRRSSSGPALAAGCTVVLKASRGRPGAAAGIRAAGRRRQAFRPAWSTSSPASARSAASVLDRASAGRARRLHRRARRRRGRSCANSAENLAEISLELGGKSPFIVFADADLDSAANASVAGHLRRHRAEVAWPARGSSSQRTVEATPCSTRLKAKAEAIRIGSPWTWPPRWARSPPRRQRAQSPSTSIGRIAAGGASLVTGGARPDGPGWYFYPPTILDCDARPGMPVLRHGIFGPVLAVHAFRDEAEAVALANDTRLRAGLRRLHPRPGARPSDGRARMRAGSSGSTPIARSRPSRPSAASAVRPWPRRRLAAIARLHADQDGLAARPRMIRSPILS